MTKRSKEPKRVLFASLWWHEDLMRGVARHAAEHNWHLNLRPALDGTIPADWNGDGIIAVTGGTLKGLEGLLERLGCPAVSLSLRQPHIKIPRVAIDVSRVARMAADHFLERGFKSHAFYSRGSKEVVPMILQEYKNALGSYGETLHDLRPRVGRTEDSSDWRKSQQLLCRALREIPKPVAVFGDADMYAIEVIEACQKEALCVPDDVAVLGMLDIPLFRECTTIPLSSVMVDFDTNTRVACELLARMMHGEPPPREPILIPPTGIAVRQSTDILAAENPSVAKAIRYMYDHHAELIRINDIAKAAGVGRRVLFLAFDRDFSQPPGAVLTRIRLDKAKRMLSGSGDKVQTISEVCGFGAAINMYHHFKRELGISPAAYRKANS